jgi:hypothetical protein
MPHNPRQTGDIGYRVAESDKVAAPYVYRIT